jgi:hypothetical protein
MRLASNTAFIVGHAVFVNQGDQLVRQRKTERLCALVTPDLREWLEKRAAPYRSIGSVVCEALDELRKADARKEAAKAKAA